MLNSCTFSVKLNSMRSTLGSEIVELKFSLTNSLNSWKVISGNGLSFNPAAVTLGMLLSSNIAGNHICTKDTILKMIKKKR